MRKSGIWVLLALLVAALALVATGCGEDDDDGGAAPPETTATDGNIVLADRADALLANDELKKAYLGR
jgi:type IV pilus biogenesis protein CpaD/CtpE